MQRASSWHHHSFWNRYAVAVGCILAAAALCETLRRISGGHQIPFMIFVLAALVAAWHGGLGAGLTAVVAATLLGDYVFLSPPGSPNHHGESEILFLATYALTTLASILLIEALHREHRRAQSAASEAHSRSQQLEQEATERKRAEKTLAEAEAKYRCLAEESLVGIYLLQDGLFVYANTRLAQIFGYTQDEIIGRLMAMDLTMPDDRPLVAENLHKREAGQTKSLQYSFRGLRKDGQVIDVEVIGTNTLYNGKPAIAGSLLDITQRQQAAAELQKAKEAAEAASRAKDHFLAVLSHELRTPLTPVLAAASAMQKDPALSPEVLSTFRMISRNVELEAKLIDDLLDLTRIAKGKIELNLRRVDIRSLLRQTIQICAGDLEAKGLQLTLDVENGPQYLRSDPARLQQVFWNLLRNAIKFTPEGGTIALRCSNGSGRNSRILGHDCAASRELKCCPELHNAQREVRSVVVEVSDSGMGMDPKQIDRLFQPFEQADQSVMRQYGGLGLGLAICKSLVDLHGGAISASSPGKGHGATFRVELPICSQRLAACDGARLKETPEGNGGRTTAPHRFLNVLLVEDHTDTARIMGQILRSQGYAVQIAHDVASALKLVQTMQFDLMISDLGLPDGSGLDLMRQLRDTGRDLRAIALSGYGMEEDIRKSRQVGFREHLTKPVNFNQLEAAIARVAITDLRTERNEFR